jgi:hypothetical protein
MTELRSPEGWPYHQWFRLFRRQQPVAAEIPGGSEGRRAWVLVRPQAEDEFFVHYFEVENDKYEIVLNTWDYDAPGLLLGEERVVVRGATELRVTLLRWLDDLSQLTDPGSTNIPI